MSDFGTVGYSRKKFHMVKAIISISISGAHENSSGNGRRWRDSSPKFCTVWKYVYNFETVGYITIKFLMVKAKESINISRCYTTL